MSTPVLQEAPTRPLDSTWVRAQFPSLKLQVNGQPAAFLDGPAGTQVPRQVMEAIQNYFLTANANTCGAFATSRANDATIAAGRGAMADFFHCDKDEVIFGQNMTTITFAVIRQVDIREADCTLDLDDLKRKITPKTKLVAVGYASNAVGTINPVGEITKLAHDAGAMMFIDAVHYAPHGAIDVRALDCDFLVCSPYKFFGPHMGTLYGKRERLLQFKPYKVRPAPDALPDRWETGTQVQELIAGIGAAVDYLAELGRRQEPSAKDRRSALLAAYRATRQHETVLLGRLIEGLLAIPKLRFFGISDPKRFHERCSTISIRIGEHNPTEIAKFLGDRGIFTWDGNYYALNLSERLGVEQQGGFLRIGLVHYNTAEEVDRLLAALREFARR